MWIVLSAEQGKHGLTHFKSICEGDVWRMLGMKEGMGHCGEAVTKAVRIYRFLLHLLPVDN